MTAAARRPLHTTATPPPAQVDPNHATVHDVYRELLYQRGELGAIHARLDAGADLLDDHDNRLGELETSTAADRNRAAGRAEALAPSRTILRDVLTSVAAAGLGAFLFWGTNRVALTWAADHQPPPVATAIPRDPDRLASH